MDKVKTILANLYYKIDAMYYELSDLDCELFVSEQREEQIKEVLLLYEQFKHEITALFNIDWDNIKQDSMNENGDGDIGRNWNEITLFLPVIDAWMLVQVIDEQVCNESVNVDTLKEFDGVMEQLKMVSVGWLV